jgi:hypothetical protein
LIADLSIESLALIGAINSRLFPYLQFLALGGGLLSCGVYLPERFLYELVVGIR